MNSHFENDGFEDLHSIIEALLRQAGIGSQMLPGGFRIVIIGSKPKRVPMDSTEPGAEVHTIGDLVIAAAEVPGARLEDIHLGLTGGTLTIVAETGDRTFRKSVDLPPVDAESMRCSCRNGVLEVTFRKAAAPG
ncbi:MAG: Hsp20/alpha crystallin family protein [Methanomicrobiales archaeon]|nr:Hsp20/alpha crystallin family protein [Methanomicrobiales archaeon]MDI6876528.1 Hsp20/alpha crystallin family protein [Methanomicrobiales archaeon]